MRITAKIPPRCCDGRLITMCNPDAGYRRNQSRATRKVRPFVRATGVRRGTPWHRFATATTRAQSSCTVVALWLQQTCRRKDPCSLCIAASAKVQGRTNISHGVSHAKLGVSYYYPRLFTCNISSAPTRLGQNTELVVPNSVLVTTNYVYFSKAPRWTFPTVVTLVHCHNYWLCPVTWCN